MLNGTFNVLVTSISWKVPLLREIRKAMVSLEQIGRLIGGDTDGECIGRYFVDRFWEMPSLEMLSSEKLVEFCRGQRVKAIVPTRDGELEFFARFAPELAEHGITVMVSPPEAVRACLDKLAFCRTLGNVTVCSPIPAALSPDELGPGLLVVKERFGAGSASLGLGLGRDEALRHAEKLEEPIFQPMITGREYSVDVYLTMVGESKGAVARLREQVVGGESRVTVSLRHPRLEAACIAIARNLGLRGHVIFQVIEDDAGGLHLIECNCRFGGASTLSVAAGLDSFYWFLLEAAGGDAAAVPFVRSAVELRQVRHPADHIEVLEPSRVR